LFQSCGAEIEMKIQKGAHRPGVGSFEPLENVPFVLIIAAFRIGPAKKLAVQATSHTNLDCKS
jgi:hypothetical protein